MAAVLSQHGEPEPRVVRRMLAASPHRGSAFDVRIHGRAALGVSNSEDHADASIVVDEGLALAFAGKLDNAEELERRFFGARAGREAAPPGAVVLAAFRSSPSLGPDLLRGVFAAAVTDGRTMWCWRDHYGFGQLFYRQERDAFVLGTEPKQVIAGSRISAEPDLEVVERIFYGDVDVAMPSAIKGVTAVPKARIVEADGSDVRFHVYWDPRHLLETARMTRHELNERFHELMTQAVARTLSGNDVVSLSGGIDSPAVAAYGAPVHLGLSGRPLAALSTVYPDYPSVDELKYITLVSETLGMPLHAYQSQSRSLDDLVEWARVCDGPMPVLPAAAAAEHYRRARALGFSTMLAGDQAELVFDRGQHLIPHLLLNRRLTALRRHIASRRRLGTSRAAIGRQILSAFVPHRIAVARARRHTGSLDWLEPAKLTEVESRFVVVPRKRWSTIQLDFYTGSGIGLEADAICQAVCGIQVRRPWADVDLYEFFLSLPAEQKFPYVRRGGKALVRELLRGRVPDVILDREDKTYFNEYIMDRIDYPSFRKLLVNPKHRIGGVKYDVLEQRIEREDFELGDYKWAVDLAKCHAFLSLW